MRVDAPTASSNFQRNSLMLSYIIPPKSLGKVDLYWLVSLNFGYFKNCTFKPIKYMHHIEILSPFVGFFTEMDVQYFSCLKSLGPFEKCPWHMVDFLHEKPQSFPRKSIIILGKLLSNPTFDPTIPPSMPDSSTVWPNVQGIWMNLGRKGCWEVAMFDVDCSKKKRDKTSPGFAHIQRKNMPKSKKNNPKHVLFMSGCKQLSRTCADDYYQISSLESNLFVEKKHLWGH